MCMAGGNNKISEILKQAKTYLKLYYVSLGITTQLQINDNVASWLPYLPMFLTTSFL